MLSSGEMSTFKLLSILFIISNIDSCVIKIQCFTHEQDCLTLPDFENVKNCCNFPKDGGVDDVIHCENIYANKGLDQNTFECNVVDCILNDTDIVLGAALTINFNSNNKTWKPVLETATVNCLKEIFTVFPTIFQKLNDQLQNQQCKLKFTSLITCINFKSYTRCPKGSWIDKMECNNLKVFVDKCGDDINTISDILSRRNADEITFVH